MHHEKNMQLSIPLKSGFFFWLNFRNSTLDFNIWGGGAGGLHAPDPTH